MMNHTTTTGIVVRRNRKGRAVYATRLFARGDTIEIAHVLIVGNQPWADRAKYPYQEWAYEFFGKCAIALGCGSLYNHSYKPNASWSCRKRSQTIRFYALKDIWCNEEILINYSGAAPGEDDLDFKVLT